MTKQLTAAFTLDSWDEQEVLDTEGARFVRTTITKTFTGDFSGVSRGEMLMAHASEGSAAYTGYERVQGTFNSADGRHGSFILRHNATMSEGEGSSEVVVMIDSGTGDLTGLSGTASIERHDDGSHTFTLDYDL